MNLGLRGIMDSDGDIHSWPTVAMTHNQFFNALPFLREGLRARWRQWDSEPGAKIDFDPGCTPEDKAAVQGYVDAIQLGPAYPNAD